LHHSVPCGIFHSSGLSTKTPFPDKIFLMDKICIGIVATFYLTRLQHSPDINLTCFLQCTWHNKDKLSISTQNILWLLGKLSNLFFMRQFFFSCFLSGLDKLSHNFLITKRKFISIFFLLWAFVFSFKIVTWWMMIHI
jgi:hypothetical protein